MYITNLSCNNEHVYEGWFDSRDDCYAQLEAGECKCPECDSNDIRMAPTAARVKTERRSVPLHIQKKIAGFRQHVFQTHEDVGDKLAETARAMHEGKIPYRPLVGAATKEQAKQLFDEKIGVCLPMPPVMDIEKN